MKKNKGKGMYCAKPITMKTSTIKMPKKGK